MNQVEIWQEEIGSLSIRELMNKMVRGAEKGKADDAYFQLVAKEIRIRLDMLERISKRSAPEHAIQDAMWGFIPGVDPALENPPVVKSSYLPANAGVRVVGKGEGTGSGATITKLSDAPATEATTNNKIIPFNSGEGQ